MEKSEYRRKLKAARLAEGLCIHCGNQPHLPDKKGCEECLRRNTDKQTKWAKKDSYARQRSYRLKVKQEVMLRYGGKCTCCGETSLPFLTIDHINNDGFLERKNGISSYGFYMSLREPNSLREDLQVLCWNCNAAKEFFGICPHQVGDITQKIIDMEDRRHNKRNNVGCKIDWPSDDELVAMIKKSNCNQVAKQLGVHNTAIRMRLKRRGLYEQVKKQ